LRGGWWRWRVGWSRMRVRWSRMRARRQLDETRSLKQMPEPTRSPAMPLKRSVTRAVLRIPCQRCLMRPCPRKERRPLRQGAGAEPRGRPQVFGVSRSWDSSRDEGDRSSGLSLASDSDLPRASSLSNAALSSHRFARGIGGTRCPRVAKRWRVACCRRRDGQLGGLVWTQRPRNDVEHGDTKMPRAQHNRCARSGIALDGHTKTSRRSHWTTLGLASEDTKL